MIDRLLSISQSHFNDDVVIKLPERSDLVFFLIPQFFFLTFNTSQLFFVGCGLFLKLTS